MPWGLIPAVYSLAGDTWPKPFDSLARKAEQAEREKAAPPPSDDELIAAAARMSPLFRGLYPQDRTE